MFATLFVATLHLFSCYHTEENRNTDCHHPWPSLDLILPINTKPTKRIEKENEYRRIFLRSLLLFWPLKASNTSLLLLMDSEDSSTPKFRDVLNYVHEHVKPHVPGGVRHALNNPIPADRHLGHDRQQRIMFYADQWSRAEYVGFVDTDCFFVTYVDRGDIFEGNKPVVNGRSGNYRSPQNGIGRDWWEQVPKGTYKLLGMLEPMRCMSYFPVVIKTAHIKEMREYIEKLHGKPFDEVFRGLYGNAYSQFNIMCTYLFYKHHEEYAWFIHDVTPGWDYVNPAPIPGQVTNGSMFTPAMRYPKPRIAVHANYRADHELRLAGPAEEKNVELLFRVGVCLGPPFPKNYSFCRFYDSHSKRSAFIYPEMFRFEGVDWTKIYPKHLLQQAMQDRLKRIEHCNVNYVDHEYIYDDLGKLMNESTPIHGELYSLVK